VSPRKPNSALRKMAWVSIKINKVINTVPTYTHKKTFAFIPGIKHNLQKHSVILMRGGRARDIPGSKYKAVRGAFDLKGVDARNTARSKYGVKYPYKEKRIQDREQKRKEREQKRKNKLNAK